MAAESVQFTDVEAVAEGYRACGYIPDRKIATSVFLLTRLDKPLLLEGPAGVGKTELAKTLAEVTGRPLLRLQCYEGQDDTKALYEWDYGKQLLYTQILRDKTNELLADAPDLDSAVRRITEHESVFFSERFLAPRPLLQAVRAPEPVRAAGRRGRPRRRGAGSGPAGDARRVPGVGPRARHFPGRAAALRRADVEQHPGPVGGAQATVPAPDAGLPGRRTRAGDRRSRSRPAWRPS